MTTPRLTRLNVWRMLCVVLTVWFALLLANAGCSSGAICYRNTDCPSGFSCQHGQCVGVTPTPVSEDAGTSTDTDAGADDSQTPDAN